MTEGKKNLCPICKLDEGQIVIEENCAENRFIINCPRCKKFTISRTAKKMAESRNLGPKPSAWIRDLNEQGAEVPLIGSDVIKELQTRLPDYSPKEKQIKLLRNIERKTEYPGQRIILNYNNDFPLAWSSGEEESFYYINSLKDRDLLSTSLAMGLGHVTITSNGWNYLEQLDRSIEDRTQAFVAMSFSEDLKPIWEGAIHRAITRTGYKPYRVDAEPHIDRIDAKIISEIKNSRFVIADVTEQKRGVYFEAGFAQGLGLPVLWCVRKDDLGNVHFDTRQYNHIMWETADDLEDQLYNFICAIIGKGKEA